MKVIKGTLVNHTIKEDLDSEVRFYQTTDDSIAKGDVVVVWAHGRLGFLKVKSILDTFEYLSAENNDVELENVPLAMTKIDTTEYKINKAFLAKKHRLEACINERIGEASYDNLVANGIKMASTEKKAEIKALKAKLDALVENPASALED